MMISNLDQRDLVSTRQAGLTCSLLLTFVLLYKPIKLFIRSVKSILRVLYPTLQIFQQSYLM